jgi:hypothetical protein
MSKIRAIFADGATGSTIRTELNSMLPFSVTLTLTAALAVTPVHIVPVASVPTGKKVYVTDILLKVNGETAWSDATGVGVNIQDTSATPVVGASVAKADLVGNAKIGKESASCVLAAPIVLGTGFTADKGLDISADKNFTAGSDIVVTVTGYIAA